ESTLCSYTLNSSKAIIGAHPVDNSGQLPTSARPPTDNFDKKQKAREQIAKLTEILTKRK
ncbi:MAG: hypothetical protein ABIP54_01990, partial [Candidatus Andersenbacteria bacterium]